jgi:hypothetical protein
MPNNAPATERKRSALFTARGAGLKPFNQEARFSGQLEDRGKAPAREGSTGCTMNQVREKGRAIYLKGAAAEFRYPRLRVRGDSKLRHRPQRAGVL